MMDVLRLRLVPHEVSLACLTLAVMSMSAA